MSDSFYDRIMTFVVKEICAAQRAGDDKRIGGAVADLAMTLGCTIRMLCEEDDLRIDDLLAQVNHMVGAAAYQIEGLASDAVAAPSGVRLS